MNLGKEEVERNNRKVGKWRKKERKHKREKGNNKNRKKNEKQKRSYDFQGRKIEEKKIKRRQNEKVVYKGE